MQCGVPMPTPPLRQISIRGKRDAGIAQAGAGAEPAGDGPIHCWAPGSQCDRLEDPMEGLRFVVPRPSARKKAVRCAWSTTPCRSDKGMLAFLAFSVRDRRGNAMATIQVGSVPAPASIFCCEKPRYGASRTDTTRRHALAVLALMV